MNPFGTSRTCDREYAAERAAARTSWTMQDRQAVPSEIAALWAREAYPSRRVDTLTLTGKWTGKTWAGTFQLVDGARKYRLACDRDGTWTVSVD